MAQTAKADRGAEARRRWVGDEIDSDPFLLPQRVTIPATEWRARVFGFIRYAVVHSDAVKATDSSPILGPFVWVEPMSAYRGVALRVAHRVGSGAQPVLIVELLHRTDDRRSVVVHASFDGADVAARWRSWGRALNLPLIVEDREGELREAERRLGQLCIDTAQPHAGANPLSPRRPLTFGASGRPRLWPRRLSTGTRPLAY